MKGIKLLLALLMVVGVFALVSFLLYPQPEKFLPEPQPPPGAPKGFVAPKGLLEAGVFPSVTAQEYQYVYPVEKETLTVTGTGIVSADPNKVDVSLGVDTERSTALQSQQDNAATMAGVRNALSGIGVSGADVVTTSFRISPVWNYQSKPPSITGYKTTHLLRVSSKDIQQAGRIIDAASEAGANIVNNVSFGLTRETAKQLKKQALELSGKEAREKAESVATGLGVRIVRVLQVSEIGVTSLVPYAARAEAAGAPAPTVISAGEVDVTATVKVVFEIA